MRTVAADVRVGGGDGGGGRGGWWWLRGRMRRDPAGGLLCASLRWAMDGGRWVSVLAA